ncbi:MerR family DNA-binding transcriptional regulator [Lacibacterium aquatile]|uniref:MerR family DNA-binding transcriptional regulator n=1 Tax=Lacibacterium aquatile TaxID=1168082 RepID=A0ABW5DSZ0_9PROT
MSHGDPTGQKLYAIGDLAAEYGISPRAIRFYEDQQLLSPTRLGVTRVYTTRDHGRLRLILRGKRLGFSLSDIKELLDLYDVDGSQVTQLKAALKKGRARIGALETQLDDLRATLDELRQLERDVVASLKAKGTKDLN